MRGRVYIEPKPIPVHEVFLVVEVVISREVLRGVYASEEAARRNAREAIKDDPDGQVVVQRWRVNSEEGTRVGAYETRLIVVECNEEERER